MKLSPTNRKILILGISESVSQTGTWISMMAVYALIVFRGAGGVAESSGIFLAGLLPTLLVSPAAGWLCDHFDRRWLMIISEVLSGLCISALIVVERMEWIFAALAMQAVSQALMAPARQSSIPQLVGEEDLTRANAFLQQLSALVKIGAPMLAGLILAVLTPHQAIVLDVVSFGLSALILTRLPALLPARTKPASLESAHSRDEAEKTESLIPALRARPGLQFLFVIIFMCIFVIIGFDVLTPVYVRDVLAAEEGFFGVCIALVGLGTLTVSAWLSAGRQQRDVWMDLAVGLALLALIPAVMGLAALVRLPALARGLVLAGCLVGGVGNGLLVIQSSTLMQTLAPVHLLGRVSGVHQATAVSAQVAGVLLTPLLVPVLLSIQVYFALSFLMLALVVAFLAFNLRRLRASAPDVPLAAFNCEV